jgi:hypothetical protein
METKGIVLRCMFLWLFEWSAKVGAGNGVNRTSGRLHGSVVLTLMNGANG